MLSLIRKLHFTVTLLREAYILVIIGGKALKL